MTRWATVVENHPHLWYTRYILFACVGTHTHDAEEPLYDDLMMNATRWCYTLLPAQHTILPHALLLIVPSPAGGGTCAPAAARRCCLLDWCCGHEYG